jgi:hypothetical protein
MRSKKTIKAKVDDEESKESIDRKIKHYADQQEIKPNEPALESRKRVKFPNAIDRNLMSVEKD